MKISKVLIILLIATSVSACATNKFIEPLCLPEGPVLEDISIEEQRAIRAINTDLLRRIANNDGSLKAHISTIERITVAHNEQFEAECL